MSVLLIDNGTTLLDKLKKLIPGEEVVKVWNEFEGDARGHELAILSGGSQIELVGNEEKFEKEFQFIKNSRIPIIGICFGCELLAVAFGGTLKKLGNKHKGIKEISLTDTEHFGSKSLISVFENHSWIIDVLPSEFEVLAESTDGPEAIKHKKRPIYGLQFHPENFVDKTEGDELFLNLLQAIKLKSGI